MGAGSSGAASGVVFGLAVVLLGQQLGYIDLSSLSGGLLALFVAALAFGLVFGLVGIALGARYVKRHAARSSKAAEAPPKDASPPEKPA